MIQERVKRIAGNKLQAIRKRYFAKHPLCQCSDKKCPHGIVSPARLRGGQDILLSDIGMEHTRAATILDHIEPLHQGGTNDESNYQGLCEACHDWKTTTERGNTSKPYAAKGLDWL